MHHLIRTLLLALMIMLPAVGEAQPNVVVILVDDGGFMDFGGFGGEAATPSINRLADAGVRFSNYHTSPLCATSRAMLLTGMDNHRTGVGTIPEVLTEAQSESPAYALRLLPGVKTLADRLRDSGYETFMTGKWHLGSGAGDLPVDHGFDRSFILDASGADNWEHKPFMPYYTEAPWFEDDRPATLPDEFYSSRFLVDQMRTYLTERDRARPFFAYIAFQAIHIPVQAPREFTDKYEGVYNQGWEAIAKQRFERAKSLGLVPQDAAPPVMHPDLRAWSSLSDEERTHYEQNMMLNAGMIEAMDFHIGRLTDFLADSGDLDNTVFVITSDNGPEFNDPAANVQFQIWMSNNGYHVDPERLGEKGYMGAIGPEWASAAAVPGSLFKMYASEGGTRVPLIISGPGIEAAPGFESAFSFVTDVTPTVLSLVGLQVPQDLDGRSLRPVIGGQAKNVYGASDPVGLEVAGNAALFKGRYKITRNTRPHGDARWRLHDVQADPAESADLSESMPALRTELLADYDAFAEAVGVIELPADFDIRAQINANTQAKMIARNIPTIIAVAAGFVLLIAGIIGMIRGRQKRSQA